MQLVFLSLNGYVYLTTVIVIITGILGAALSSTMFKLFKIEHPLARGLALGLSAHALGTSKAVELGEVEASMASLALILNAIITVAFAPSNI